MTNILVSPVDAEVIAESVKVRVCPGASEFGFMIRVMMDSPCGSACMTGVDEAVAMLI